MAVLNQLRLPDGRLVRVEEWGELPIHSSAIVGATQQQDVIFFNFGKGDNFPGTTRPATELDTNLDKGAQLIGGEMFVFAHCLEPIHAQIEETEGGLIFHEFMRQQFKETLSKVYVQWTLANKIFAEGLVHWFPQGGGMYGFDVQTSAWITSNGVPTPASIRRYNIPVHIASASEVFQGRFKFPNDPLQGPDCTPPLEYQDWKWYWRLEGLRRRQVV